MRCSRAATCCCVSAPASRRRRLGRRRRAGRDRRPGAAPRRPGAQRPAAGPRGAAGDDSRSAGSGPRGAASGVSGRQRRQRRGARRAGGRRTGRGAPQPGPAGHRRTPGPAAGYLQQVAGGVPAHQAAGRFPATPASPAVQRQPRARRGTRDGPGNRPRPAGPGHARRGAATDWRMPADAGAAHRRSRRVRLAGRPACPGALRRGAGLADAAIRRRPSGQARMVRDLGRSLGKQVRLLVEGESTQVDRDVLENSKRRSPTCYAMPSITVSRRRKPASPPASRPRAGSPSAPATTPACWSWN